MYYSTIASFLLVIGKPPVKPGYLSTLYPNLLARNILVVLNVRKDKDGNDRIPIGKRVRYWKITENILYCIRQVLKQSVIMYGYRVIGMYPVSVRQTMSQCTRQLSKNFEKVENRLPQAAELAGRNGEVKT